MEEIFTEKDLEQIKQLHDLYRDVKVIILIVEEVDPESRSNLQIAKELRDAFDHLMTVIDTRVNLESNEINDRDGYVEKNMDKVIGHVYRAAFDALDGSIISLKELIVNALEEYPSDVIKDVIPNYWNIRGKLHELTENVASYRSRKDLGQASDQALNDYIRDVKVIDAVYREILSKGDVLDERNKEKSKAESKAYLKSIGSMIIAALVGALLTFFLTC